MKSVLNILLLVLVVVCLVVAVGCFGGVVQEYAAPLYAVGAMTVLVWAVKLLADRRVSWIWSPMHAAVLAVVMYAAWRAFRSPVEYDARMELIQVGFYALIYFLAACNLYRSRDRTVVVVALLVLAVAEAAYGFWQFATATDKVFGLDRPLNYHGRGSGTYFCPNHLAGFLVIVFCLVLARIVIHRPATGSLQSVVVQKLPEVYGAVCVLAGLWVTFSRGSWLALAVAVVVFLLWSERARVISSRVAVVIFALLMLAGAAAWSVPSVRHRLEQVLSVNWHYTFESQPVELADPALEGRKAMWAGTLRMIRDHPWQGTGPGTWQWFYPRYRSPSAQGRPQYAHSDVLQLVSDYGLIGLTLVVVALGGFYWQAARLSGPDHSAEQRAFAVGSATAVTALLVHSLVDFNLHIPANALLLATIMGLTVATGGGDGWTRRREMNRWFKLALGCVLLLAAGGIGWWGGRSALASRQTALAEPLNQMHEWDQALAACHRALANDARLPGAHAQLGEIYRLHSETLEAEPGTEAERRQLALLAISGFKRSLELNPFQTEVQLRLALAYEQAGQPNAALQAYQQALMVDPYNAFNLLMIGLFYHRSGDDTQAVAYLTRSAELESGEPIAQDCLRQIQGPRQ